MGFFSYKCAKSKVSIPAYPWAGFPKEFSEVVQVLPDDTTISGAYNGYGRIGKRDTGKALAPFVTGKPKARREEIFSTPDGFNKMESMTKIVLKSEYKGEMYKDLEVSEHDQTQGYFYDEKDRDDIYASHGMTTGDTANGVNDKTT